MGTVHDFRVFKESLVGVLPEDILAMLDSGYQGVTEYLPNAMIPYKATKMKPLTVEEKAFNTMLSKLRIVIEHINRELKVFRYAKKPTEEKVSVDCSGLNLSQVYTTIGLFLCR